jgi:hypothetical protein
MADSAIYFPYINVPRQGLLRVLLYWDELGSMIPEGVEPDSPTQELVDAELVRPIRPKAYLDSPQMMQDFAELLDTVLVERERASSILIHIEKGGRILEEILHERGLVEGPVRRGRGRAREWLKVEGNAGALYLAYLALSLARRLDMEPVTDQAQYFEAVSGVRSLRTSASIDHLRVGVLRDVLPSPSRDIPISDLVQFKEQHGPLLRALRREVERHVLTCAQESDPEIRRRLSRSFSAEMLERAEEVRRRMAERRWPTVQSTVCGLLLGIPSIVGAVATDKPPLAASAAVPLLVEWIRSRWQDAGPGDMPAAYALLANNHFG